MDEEISIINNETKKEKVLNFFKSNKKKLFLLLIILILIPFSIFSYQIIKDKNKDKLSSKFNLAVSNYENGNKSEIKSIMKEIINNKDKTYSPLALYFLIDNDLIENQKEVNELFRILIDKTSLEKEIRNLIIYKKALYNADSINENELLDILKPVINSESVWTSHALYLIAEFFYSKNEKQKSKEFFNKIISLDNANKEIIKESQKRLNRDLSE